MVIFNMGSKSKKENANVWNSTNTEEGDSYSENHKVLLQYLMHVKMVTEKDLSRVHSRVFNGSESLNDSIGEITKKINLFKMDVKKVNCDLTGEPYYTIFNSSAENFIATCCTLTQNQREFFKQVLTTIAYSHEGRMGRMQSLNCSQVISKSEAEDTIDLLLDMKLLTESAEGLLYLTPLAIAEFEPVFKTGLDSDLLTCNLCRHMVIYGKVCEGCKRKFHLHCVSKWTASGAGCPTCQHPWPSENDTDEESELMDL